jgi:hypothetical protein
MSCAKAWRARHLYMVFTGLWAHCRYGSNVLAQRARSAVETSHRSIHPNIPGLPWWAALVIATTATAIGYAIDAGSGHKDLTDVFAVLYIAGCVVAVLTVQQSGVFTAVIQPPLILFCAVPGAYWLFHGGKIGNLKDLLINCGYPLIERFPLMLGTAGGVLLIGLIRWYFGLSHRTTATANSTDDVAATTDTTTESKSVIGGIAAKLAWILGRDGDDEAPSAKAQRVQAADRRLKTSRADRSSRSAQRLARTRSRNSRVPREREYEPPVEGRRHGRRGSTRARDFEPDEPPRRPRRRPGPQGDHDPYGRRGAYERPASRGSGFDPYAYEPYESYEPYAPPRRRAGPTGDSQTHHPISQVRYRGSAPRDELRDEPRTERRGRSRTPGRSQGRPPRESWEYDA